VRGQILFSPANTGPWAYANQVITFHDASVFAVPRAYSATFRAKYSFIFKQLSKRAALILTDSKFSQRELAQYLKMDEERFSVIHLGSDHLDPVQADPQTLGRHSLEKNQYFLLVGNQSLHKNFERIVQATSLLEKGIKYVAVGGSFRKVFKETSSKPLPSNIQYLGFVSDQELKTLYQNALGLIFPSTYEGFGLPVLEAMRNGCPVLCANYASIPEVAGDAALYFDPFDVENIASVISRFLQNQGLQDHLREMGYHQSEKFKWSTTAITTVERILGVHSRTILTS
jgi:glycosyltransferase involved in cell wall biosynthesis